MERCLLHSPLPALRLPHTLHGHDAVHPAVHIRRPCICASSVAQTSQKSSQQKLPVEIAELQKGNQLLFELATLLFSIKPLWRFARDKARARIAERGLTIGVDMKAEVDALQRSMSSWEQVKQDIEDPQLEYPEYYNNHFHGYDTGNLGWEVAFQVPSTSKLVHAPVMDPKNKRMDPDGDAKLRRSYSMKLQRFLKKVDAKPVEDIVDLGCSTGLSSSELQRIFPLASITGIDLSPHMLAVATVLQARNKETGKKAIHFKHAKAESTGLDSESADLVSMCLLLHEMPNHGTIALLQESFRLLRPGGAIAIMEMNPLSERFKKIFANPFAFVPFKATEPLLEEYLATDVKAVLEAIGFEKPIQEPSTPGHFTLVAKKP